MVFNATFNNIYSIISWRSVLLVKETGVPWDKRLVLQFINGVSSNTVEGEQNIFQLKPLILTLGLKFKTI
jgi:hypothetical protein